MSSFAAFCKRKDIEISVQRYLIDALGAMAQGLFASLLMGTILSTIGQQAGIDVLVQVGDFAKSAAGPAMAVSIGFALKAPSLVLFSLVAVGYAANSLGGAGGPLAVLVVAIVASECGKLVANETKIDILVTPSVTILVGCLLSMACAPSIGAGATAVGSLIMWATELQPFFMGYFGIGFGRHCPYAANLFGCHLRGVEPHWFGGRRCCCRLLCSDGWFCGNELQGKPLGRFDLARSGNVDAANGQYRAQPAHLDSPYAGFHDHWAHRDMRFPAEDERPCHFVGYGYVRLGWSHWRVYRLGCRYGVRRNGGHYRYGLGGSGANLFRASCGVDLRIRSCFA